MRPSYPPIRDRARRLLPPGSIPAMLLTMLAFGAMSLQTPKTFYWGGDPSEIPEVEASGAAYKVAGKQVDPLVAMKEAGWNAVRLRIWNDPKDKFCDLNHTLAMAKRIKAAGLTLMLDFHYSDWWADPGKQNKPAAWKDMGMDELKVAVREYSRDVVKALVDQGTPPAVVQPGNEVVAGMLWPEGRIHGQPNGWDKFMDLTKAAIQGIREGAGKHPVKIMAHIDKGGKMEVSKYWFENYFSRGGEADILGLSYYPMWHGNLDELKENLAYLAKTYKQDILIAETAYPYRGWNEQTRQYDDVTAPLPQFKPNPEGQAAFLRELVSIVKNVPDQRGVGILWWAPAWVGPTGLRGGWDRLTMFDNQTGEALPSFFGFKGVGKG